MPVAAAHTRVALLSLSGRLLVFPLDEVKRQPGGGRGLTLMDVDAKDPMLSIASCGLSLVVHGLGRGDKPKTETLGPTALATHEGRRARKGLRIEAFKKVLRIGT